MISNSKLSNHIDSSPLNDTHLDCFADVANKLADAVGDVIRSYFRKKFEIFDKEDLSPVTIADQAAEEAMVSIIFDNFPSHAVVGCFSICRKADTMAAETMVTAAGAAVSFWVSTQSPAFAGSVVGGHCMIAVQSRVNVGS